MLNIVLDGFGGDFAPTEPVKGAILALKENPDLHITITGDETQLKELITSNGGDLSRFTIVHAPDVISNDAQATIEFRKKPESSLVKAYDILRKDDSVCGLVSAGCTGAVLTGGFLKIGRISGVSRPALFAQIFTTDKNKDAILCDCGANAECKPINLVHFAIMASEYSKYILGVENPKVALLNIGAESEKGNELVKETYKILKDNKQINFIGNVEGSDILKGVADIIVTDGYSGNIAIKSCEGSLKAFNSMLKEEIKSRFMSKIGYLFMRKSFNNFKKRVYAATNKGAVLVGIKKLVIKVHGNSTAKIFKSGIMQVVEMHTKNLCAAIEQAVQNYNLELPEATE